MDKTFRQKKIEKKKPDPLFNVNVNLNLIPVDFIVF